MSTLLGGKDGQDVSPAMDPGVSLGGAAFTDLSREVIDFPPDRLNLMLIGSGVHAVIILVAIGALRA